MKRRLAKHGTVSRYTNQKCRCDKCKKAWREYQRGLRAKLKDGKKIPHGTVNGFDNYLCRCRRCVKAKAKSRLEAKKEDVA